MWKLSNFSVSALLLLLAGLALTCHAQCPDSCVSSHSNCETANNECSLVPATNFDSIKESCSESPSGCWICTTSCLEYHGLCEAEYNECVARYEFANELEWLTLRRQNCAWDADITDATYCEECKSLADDFLENRNRAVQAAETIAAQCQCRYDWLTRESCVGDVEESCEAAQTISDANGYACGSVFCHPCPIPDASHYYDNYYYYD